MIIDLTRIFRFSSSRGYSIGLQGFCHAIKDQAHSPNHSVELDTNVSFTVTSRVATRKLPSGDHSKAALSGLTKRYDLSKLRAKGLVEKISH